MTKWVEENYEEKVSKGKTSKLNVSKHKVSENKIKLDFEVIILKLRINCLDNHNFDIYYNLFDYLFH